LATATQAEQFFSEKNAGKFADQNSAVAFCNESGGELAKFDSVDLTGKSGWFWVSQADSHSPKIALKAGSNKTKTHKQMADKGLVAFAACDKTSSGENITPVPECTATGGLENYSGDYVFYPDEGVISHQAARKVCQALGYEWDMLIISGSNEYEFVKNSINDNCWNHMAWWLGFYETGDLAQPGDVGTVTTVFGKNPEWKLNWASDSDFGQVQNEPNNQKGVEDCVRMKNGLLNDAVCLEGWTGLKKNDIGMGFVCERHNNIDQCEPAKKTPDSNPKYQLNSGAGLNRAESKDACKALGDGWDLAIVNDAEEHAILVEQINCAENAFWLGVMEVDGEAFDDKGNKIGFTSWDSHSNVLNPEANNQQGDEKCVRMRGSMMNDALCDREWTGPKWLDIPMGYICEFTAPECKVKSGATPLQDDEYKIFPQHAPNTWTFVDARQKCKSLGKNWDLVIFNYNREHEMIMDILTDNCVNDHAYWVGYTESGGDATTVLGRPTAVGATTSIKLPWDLNTSPTNPEPNDKLGDESCVRMHAEFGLMNDAICSRTWTGGPKQQTGMGIICEKHNPCESDRGLPADAEHEIEDKYYIAPASFINGIEAQAACQARGDGWDLVIIDDPQEHKKLNALLNGCNPYWIGGTNTGGSTYIDYDGNPIAFAEWDTHLGHNVNPNEPNDVLGDEQCVRMRGGKYNDALCTDKNGFNKKEMQGYICEKQLIPAPTSIPDPAACLTCGQNEAVKDWTVYPGCKAPMECKARLEIVDAWKMGNGVNRPKRWGFVGKIKLPAEVVDGNRHFSVLIRFSKKVRHGHFQLWNMNFWNFYNGGYEVLIHSKHWKSDRHDKYSVAFVAEELDSDEYPELLFWYDRQTIHHCFQPSMHHGQVNNQVSAFSSTARSGANQTPAEGMYDVYESEMNNQPLYGASTQVRIRNGQIIPKKRRNQRQRRDLL